MTISLESLLAARLFLSPRLLGNRLFFLSNLGQGGHLSLYAMDVVRQGRADPKSNGRLLYYWT